MIIICIEAPSLTPTRSTQKIDREGRDCKIKSTFHYSNASLSNHMHLHWQAQFNLKVKVEHIDFSSSKLQVIIDYIAFPTFSDSNFNEVIPKER